LRDKQLHKVAAEVVGSMGLQLKDVRVTKQKRAARLRSLVQQRDAGVYAALLAFEQKYNEVRLTCIMLSCKVSQLCNLCAFNPWQQPRKSCSAQLNSNWIDMSET